MSDTIKTERGEFAQDACGIWHYRHLRLGHVDSALQDALAHRPGGAAWFWFNGTFAPMLAGDTWETLGDRWFAWRREYQEDGQSTTRLLAALAGLR